jgi:hypothetical protein
VTEGIDIGAGPPDTVLPPGPAGAGDALHRALADRPERRRGAVAAVVREHPAWPYGWAAMAEVTDDDLEAYAYCRVGYHRGLDALRKAGWRGSGYVRWRAPDNRGFLRCLEGLRRSAEAIGEHDEAQRCAQFLRQLDPAWPPSDLG